MNQFVCDVMEYALSSLLSFNGRLVDEVPDQLGLCVDASSQAESVASTHNSAGSVIHGFAAVIYGNSKTHHHISDCMSWFAFLLVYTVYFS